MKKIFYLFMICMLLSNVTSATVITVDNNVNSPGQFTSLQNAINSASAGDTLYVSGSPYNYGQVTIKVRLTIFGPGYNPIKQNPINAYVQDFYLDTLSGISGASGTKISGFSTNTIGFGSILHNISADRMIFGVGFNCSNGSTNINIRNCIFNNCNINVNNASNILIENNLFKSGGVINSTQGSVVINNNVFLNTIGSGTFCFGSVSNAAISNNIFWGTSPLGGSVSNNTFNNNLTYQTGSDNIPGGSNSGTANLVGVNPQFVNAPMPVLDYSYDYNVSGGSQAHNAGTDGTDMGIFGGMNPIPDLSGMPTIPQIFEMNINNPIVLPAGALDVNFKSRKNQ